MNLEPVTCPSVPPDFHLKIRDRFVKRLHEVASNDANFKGSVSLFKGVETIPKNYDDIEYLPEQ